MGSRKTERQRRPAMMTSSVAGNPLGIVEPKVELRTDSQNAAWIVVEHEHGVQMIQVDAVGVPPAL